MGTESSAKATAKLVKLDKGLKLAEAWVSKMSRSLVEDESIDFKFEGRPPRLGLGAKVRNHAVVTDSADPLERKLLKKLSVDKRRPTSKGQEESNPSNVNELSDEDDDDEPQSRTTAFSKKRAIHLAPSSQAKKKHK